MADFLLVHGSCHGAWCWRGVIPALEARGHSARAIDLPGHNDGRVLASVTLRETAEAVLMAAGPETIVMGHSWAGFPITAAADINPGGLRGLIYLCAYVPAGGMSMVDMRKAGPRQTVAEAARKTPAGDAYTIDPERVPDLFYHDCPPDAVAYALPRLCPQPLRPQQSPLQTGPGWAATPKAYIRCDDDRTIPPEYQDQMAADWPAAQKYSMPTSHSPFFADPDGLADLMGKIAKDF